MIQVLYCEKCYFNYPIGAAAKRKCPNCDIRLTVVDCADVKKLETFIEDLNKKRE